MNDVKLPDLTKLKNVKKRLKKLPPQISAEDTSNWDKRNISSPTSKKPRQFDLIREKTGGRNASALTADELDKLYKAKKPS